jgi:hypothetical protein
MQIYLKGQEIYSSLWATKYSGENWDFSFFQWARWRVDVYEDH